QARAEQLARGLAVDDDDPQLRARADAILLYSGYESRMRDEVARARGDASDLPLGADLDYLALAGLSRECAERLAAVRPSSTAQAARIPGITPAAVACVWAHARVRMREAARLQPPG
ncbi:MAG: hypothetical protein IAG13_27310, partial [Deltaproteobacteria bacterium]|nr:hypothetical protein [Nannocystaceae bacterium]